MCDEEVTIRGGGGGVLPCELPFNSSNIKVSLGQVMLGEVRLQYVRLGRKISMIFYKAISCYLTNHLLLIITNFQITTDF